jgi:hypothetical protein
LESAQAGRFLKMLFRTHTIFLGVEKKSFQHRLATEAAELAWKARHFKIRKPDTENRHVEFTDSSS